MKTRHEERLRIKGRGHVQCFHVYMTHVWAGGFAEVRILKQKCHRLRRDMCFSWFWRLGGPRSRISSTGETCFPGSQSLFLCPYKTKNSPLSFNKGTNPIERLYIHDLIIIPPTPHIQTPSHCRFRFQHIRALGRNIESITQPFLIAIKYLAIKKNYSYTTSRFWSWFPFGVRIQN